MKNNTITVYASQAKYSLVASGNGVSLRSRFRGMASGGNHGKRGRVAGFSMASARRLRHLLFSLDYSDAVAVTLTHPDMMSGMRGPESAFDALRMVSKRFPWLRALVWRKEVTEHGTPHYHCIVWPADGVEAVDAGEKLVAAWIDSCMSGWSMPSVFVEDQKSKMYTAHHDARPWRRAIQSMRDTRYLRYLLDHQSKHKITQSATDGRAWGVWFRARLPFVHQELFDLTLEQYWVAARILRKATRYCIKADCVGGYKHTAGRRARGVGNVDFFGRGVDGALASRVLAAVQSGCRPLQDDRMAAGRYFRMQFQQAGPL